MISLLAGISPIALGAPLWLGAVTGGMAALWTASRGQRSEAASAEAFAEITRRVGELDPEPIEAALAHPLS